MQARWKLLGLAGAAGVAATGAVVSRNRRPQSDYTPEELRECLQHALTRAGAPKLMTGELIVTLCDHAQGNLRALMNMASELLALAAQREARHIDEQLFFETFSASSPPAQLKVAGRKR